MSRGHGNTNFQLNVPWSEFTEQFSVLCNVVNIVIADGPLCTNYVNNLEVGGSVLRSCE